MREKLAGRPYVVIHPGIRDGDKTLGSGTVRAKLRGAWLSGTSGSWWSPDPAKNPLPDRWRKEIDGASIMLGLTIPELAELIRGARLYIGNDSGPMHLAAAVGTPTIAVWGSSDSRRWRPWSVDHRVVQNPFECNPCPGYRCLVADSPLCIESVTVDQVNDAVEEMLR